MFFNQRLNETHFKLTEQYLYEPTKKDSNAITSLCRL